MQELYKPLTHQFNIFQNIFFIKLDLEIFSHDININHFLQIHLFLKAQLRDWNYYIHFILEPIIIDLSMKVLMTYFILFLTCVVFFMLFFKTTL